MARSICALALALTFLALSELLCGCLGAEYGWPPGKEFSFAIQGENLAGLPQLKAQYAGFRYQGEVRVQTHSPRVLLVKMFNMNYTKIHEELQNGWWRGLDLKLKNKTKTLPITTSTIVVKLTKSTSPELVIQSGLDDWQVNFIKGLVSNLLAYINENFQSSPNSNRMSKSMAKDVFSVMEDSLVGRCEVLYEVSKLPMGARVSLNTKLCGKQPIWEITKTRNYSNCQLLSEDHGHLPSRDCTPGGNNCGQFWTRASLTQMIGCGEKNNLMLLSSVSVSVVNAQLHLQNNSQAVVNSNLNLTLISALDLKQKFNPPQNKQTINSLLYSYSPMPKVVYSHSCQDRNDMSKEENSSNESQSREDSTGKKNKRNKDKKNINKSKEQDENEHEKEGSNKKSHRSEKNRSSGDSNQSENESSGPREKRSLRKNLGNKRNIKSNESDDDSNEGDNRFPHNNQRSKKNFNSQKNKRKNTHWQKSSEETDDQPSEELELENQWKISSKEQKNVPPHQPFHMFTLAHRTSYDLSCLSPKLRQLVADIASDLQDINILPEKHTLDKISLAVDICRTLPLDQLQTVSEEVFEVHSGAANLMKNNERKVYRDIITMCGTHPALQLAKGWIERQQVEGEEAVEMIASFSSHVFSPTQYFVQDFFEMVQQVSQKNNNQLTITAVLALSNLVRDACVQQYSRVHHFSSIVTPVCDRKLAGRIAEWFTHQLDSSPHLTRAYIEALGNLGTSETINTLRDIALGASSSYYQTSAVFAMRYQVMKKNPEVATLLLSFYHNYSLPVSSRIASVALLVYAKPSLAIWQRLAISTYYEPSWAVSSFVSSALRTMATSKDSVYSHMTKSAYMVQPLSRSSKVNSNLPYNLVSTQISDDFQRLIMEQLNWMYFYDFTNLYYRHSSRDSGFLRTNFEANLVLSNPDGLWNALKELISSSYSDHNHRPLSSSRGVEHSLSWIRESLDLYSRKMPSPQAELHLKINNMLERMILINKDTIRSWAKDSPKMLLEGLVKGKSLYYQKTDMDCFYISTTTEMGFPVELTVRAPWIVNGMAELNVTKEGLQIETSLMYSSQLLSSVAVMSGWDNVASSAGAYATNFVQLPPLRMVLSLDNTTDKNSTPTEAIKLSTSYVDQHRLLYFSMQPFTSQRKLKVHQPMLLSPDTLKVKTGETKQMPISWMSQYINTVYSTEEKENYNPMDFIGNARMIVGFPMMMPNMEQRSFETVMNPLYPVVMNFSMSSASKSMGLLEIDPPKDTMIGKLFNFVYKLMGFTRKSYGDSKDYTPASDEDFGDSPRNKKDKNMNKHENQTSEEETTTISNDKQGTSNGKKDKNNDRRKDRGSSKEEKFTTEMTTTEKNKDQLKKKSKASSSEEDFMDFSNANNEQFQVYSTTYESIAGNFNASEIDPFANSANGSSHTYLIEQVLDKITSGRAMVLGFNIMATHPEQSTNVSVYAAYASTYSERANRVGLFMKKESTQVRMTLSHEDPIDLTTDLKRRVDEDLMHKVFVDYVQVSSGKERKAFIKAKLGASRKNLEQLKDSPLLEACSQNDSKNRDMAIDQKCQSLLSQSKEIGSGNITVYYNDDAKTIEKTTVKYMNAARVILPRTEEKPGEGSNTIQFSFEVNPRTHAVDTFLTTPAGSLNSYRYPLDQVPMSTALEWAMQVSPPSEYCGLSTQRLKTFDNADFQHKMKDNWYLVTRDCSDKYGISVIAQSTTNNSMMVELNIEDYFVLTIEEGPKVSVNSKLQPLDENHPLLMLTSQKGYVIGRIVHTPDHTIHIQLPSYKLDLVYSQTSLITRAKAGLQGRLCGLCGTYSGSGIEKFKMADGSTAGSPAEFASSYMLRGSKSERYH